MNDRTSRLAMAMSIAGMAFATSALADPGTPGVPQDPVTVYAEDFENLVDPDTPIFLDAYTGAAPLNMTYTAHPDWISGPACNGIIASYNNGDPGATGCSPGVFTTYIMSLARALGDQFGGGDDNHIMSDVTVTGFPAAPTPAATFETVGTIPLSGSSRYLSARLNVAVTTCQGAHPLLRFFLLDGGSAIPVNNAGMNPCTDTTITVPGGNGGIRIGTLTSDIAILFSGSSAGVRLTNDQTSGSGNDYAVDDIQLIDVTPQLDKEFSPTNVAVGEVSTLTFTITNTSELSAKNGWSFTDTLPEGLTVADPVPSTTCPAGAVTAPVGGSTIQVSGNLNGGMASCTVTVSVSASTSGTYTNDASNITSAIGVSPPGSTTLEVAPTADLAIVKTVSPDDVISGDEVVYTLQVTNNGPDDADGAVVTDPGVPDSLECTALACSAAGGATCPGGETPAQLAAGLVIPTFPNGGEVTLELTCTVTATGN